MGNARTACPDDFTGSGAYYPGALTGYHPGALTGSGVGPVLKDGFDFELDAAPII